MITILIKRFDSVPVSAKKFKEFLSETRKTPFFVSYDKLEINEIHKIRFPICKSIPEF
jgi:hypothetical protein